MITYDEVKRRRNLAKHDIDLAALESAFDFPMVTDDGNRLPYGEQRLRSLAQVEARVVVLIWVARESGAHLISCRYANKHETQCDIDSI